MERMPIPEKREESFEDTFQRHYPEGVIFPIGISKLPPAIDQYISERTRLLVHPDQWTPDRAHDFREIVHTDGTKTYTAEEEKVFDSGTVETLIYFCDADSTDTSLGNGQIRLNTKSQSDFFKDKPFVDWTESLREREGLGLRRLVVMNAYSQARFKQPLYSSTIFISGKSDRTIKLSQLVWEKLVVLGKAVKFSENGKERYRFL